MAPWSFSALRRSRKHPQQPLSGGVLHPQTVTAPTGVAQTGNADHHIPAPTGGDIALSASTGATYRSSFATTIGVPSPGLMDVTTCAHSPQGNIGDAVHASTEGIPKVTDSTYRSASTGATPPSSSATTTGVLAPGLTGLTTHAHSPQGNVNDAVHTSTEGISKDSANHSASTGATCRSSSATTMGIPASGLMDIASSHSPQGNEADAVGGSTEGIPKGMCSICTSGVKSNVN
ncbi:hypothetical protein BKA82DRAFT_477314 [Pisolithus tinctorius]|uniref:Uncharacterized protein n=1 Tax=Pisolithus tinctorius Marx 270 TaxID=870435 RepID=A0A0C3PYT2_PISTI|nr:hypothetical protein BKA82DRAFT_477314 [Pisolithus tinctorius]KIO14424.1 hypothetical protein M404DRAFT_477314 [Pisolithus tinctorius Marx 270]